MCVRLGGYRAGKEFGDGVGFSADRQTADRFVDGKPQAEISLAEARELAGRFGLPVPPLPDGSYEGDLNASGEPEGRGHYRGTYSRRACDTNEYIGEWRAGMLEGKGTYTFGLDGAEFTLAERRRLQSL